MRVSSHLNVVLMNVVRITYYIYLNAYFDIIVLLIYVLAKFLISMNKGCLSLIYIIISISDHKETM